MPNIRSVKTCKCSNGSGLAALSGSHNYLCSMLEHGPVKRQVEDCSRAKLTACKHLCCKTPKARVATKLVMQLLSQAVRRICGTAGCGGLEFLAAGFNTEQDVLSNPSIVPVCWTQLQDTYSGSMNTAWKDGHTGHTPFDQ